MIFIFHKKLLLVYLIMCNQCINNFISKNICLTNIYKKNYFLTKKNKLINERFKLEFFIYTFIFNENLNRFDLC